MISARLNRSTSRVFPDSPSSETGGFRSDNAPPRRHKRRIVISLVVTLSCWGFLSTPTTAQTELKAATSTIRPAAAESQAPSSSTPGNEACAKCHAAIWASYSTKPMAHGSGLATQDFIPGDFTDAASGVHYRVYLEDGHAWLSFDRDGPTPLHGKRRLDYVIGSGHRGKTYVFSDEGFAFESPINFYAGVGAVPGGQWDMTPKHRGGKEVPLTLPAAASCLHCHTSGAQIPEDGTENKYASPLFAHGGITCERCHGDDLSHGVVTKKKSGKVAPETAAGVGGPPPRGIINPAKLSPVRRDAICMQCHLEGNAIVDQPGRHLYQFRAGEDLSEFVRYYVLTSDGKEKLRAVSQFEALAQSACKRSAGAALTCTTCHDPHSAPKPAERVAYYRAKCLSCHGDRLAKHHVEQQDCTACHMPRVQALDVAHTQDSDHRILRVPATLPQNSGSAVDSATAPSSDTQLVQFPPVNGPESPRGLALAWSTMTAAGSEYAADQAQKFLTEAAVQNPDDPLVLQALGYMEESRGKPQLAREHYERALRVNPLAIDAAANLALLEAQQGNFGRAIDLWKSAFARYPGRSNLGINLARAQCLSGHGDESRATIARVLQFNPDLSLAHDMLRQLQSGEVKCDGK